MNSWLRLWHDMPNDPKWRTISRVSQTSISEVMAVYVHLLVQGSTNATERGQTQPTGDEDIASALDLGTDVVTRIKAAMQGRVLDGDRLTGWEARQPKREDGSAERAKAYREKKEAERNRTQPNANEPKRRGEEEEIQRRTPIQPSEKKTPKGVQGGVSEKTVGYDVGKHLSDDGWAAAKRTAEGWDIHRLVQIYNAGISKRGAPRNPNAAFPAWCASYTKGRPPA
jgi:hypothetical protein